MPDRHREDSADLRGRLTTAGVREPDAPALPPPAGSALPLTEITKTLPPKPHSRRMASRR